VQRLISLYFQARKNVIVCNNFVYIILLSRSLEIAFIDSDSIDSLHNRFSRVSFVFVLGVSAVRNRDITLSIFVPCWKDG